ncbi:dihydrofolate reductase [Frigoriglobus tundricola]|uniref:Dihydrofolate reductase n=1 Tax=Frigoriglobus tundricola TaxID=2774151 RepID=A0A6M5YQ45_9BACT|nr:dihydrofolate reductase [Frigoriglobus tundricola]QJW95624.1 Dihydrofolate reductase [Frigoriglobus tundricola]
MLISLIAAMDRSGVIGNETGLPWHLPKDLRRFRNLTRGKAIILGRKTLELIGHPLPERANVVLTRNYNYTTPGALVAHDVVEALRLAEQESVRFGASEIMVIGGGEVYHQLLPRADRMYLTVVGGEPFTGTAKFPLSLLRELPFAVTEHATFATDEKNRHPHDFLILDRVSVESRPLSRPLDSLLDVA